MKRTLSLILGLLAAGCLSNEAPIKLGPAFALQGSAATPGQQVSCNINSSVYQTRGSLDISANPAYVIAFGTGSDLLAPGILNSNGTQVGSTTDNDFVGNQLLLSYVATPAVSLPAETIAVAVVVPAGAASPTNWAAMDIFGPKAAQTLYTSVTPGNPVNVNVTLQLKGALRSGEPAASNAFTYPVEVYSSGFTGCGGGRLLPSGACGAPGGQDGTVVGCCPTDGGTFVGC